MASHTELDRQLRLLERKVESCDVFQNLTEEKRDELVDASFMSAVRSNTEVEAVAEVIRSGTAFDERFFSEEYGNIFEYVTPELRGFAERLFVKKAGGVEHHRPRWERVSSYS